MTLRAVFFDLIGPVAVWPAAHLLKLTRRIGLQKLPRIRATLRQVGVLPIRDHYYEPQIRFEPGHDFDRDRHLPGIDWNETGQLRFLERLVYARELAGTIKTNVVPDDPMEFYFGGRNDQFGEGDAEYLYQVIRALKPRRLIEIGSGNSTRMAIRAIAQNKREDVAYSCMHICIEPYEMPWLEQTGVAVVRKRIEDVPLSFFSELEENDILFIDSSHIIRPHGDVLREYFEVLPELRAGVVVHVHDIFSPKNYPRRWVVDDQRLWNEQYLLEAFLTNNDRWEILGALNFLHAHHSARFAQVAPYVTANSGPGSFYMQKTRS